jgi:hypothetical protein
MSNKAVNKVNRGQIPIKSPRGQDHGRNYERAVIRSKKHSNKVNQDKA